MEIAFGGETSFVEIAAFSNAKHGYFLFWVPQSCMQKNWKQATKFYIKLLLIDQKYNIYSMPALLMEDIKALKKMLSLLNESQFSAIWQEVTGAEFTGEIRDLIMGDE